MAFIAMIFASIFLIVVAIGLGILLIGIIFDIIWGVKKHKQKKVSRILKAFAVILTTWGVIQGIGPLIIVGCMSLKAKMDYKAEISDIPENYIIKVDEDDDSFYEGFDLNGIHYVGSTDRTKQVIFPQVSHKNFKVEKLGAIVQGDRHFIIEKINNDLDANIVQLGTIDDPYVDESELYTINEYYKNEAPLYCEVNDSTYAVEKTIEKIDSAKIREIRDYIEASGSPYEPYTEDEVISEGYMLFYSFDDVYCIDISYKETKKGMVIECWGDHAYVPDEYVNYLKLLINN